MKDKGTMIYIDIDGKDYEVRILSWRPYKPAQTYGDPLDCYPEEGGDGEWTLIDPETDEEMYVDLSYQQEEQIYNLINEFIDLEKEDHKARLEEIYYDY